MAKMIRVESSYFVAGVEVGGKAAPIISYLKNRTEDEIINYCYIRGWEYTILPDAPQEEKDDSG